MIPGLADMHVHLFTDDEFPDALAEDEFKIMIAHGVTTIRLRAIEKREKYIAIRNKIVKAIYDAGGRVMAGSDTPEWLLLYGYTLHLEMIDLRDAGLSNYAALEAATRILRCSSELPTKPERSRRANAPTWCCSKQTRSTISPILRSARACC